MSRSVLFDTETTGLNPLSGDRVIEIAALELFNDLPTGRHLHVLIDPERDIPEDATRVHGFTRSHLHGKPLFASIAGEMLDFFGQAPLIAHNAPFDFGFVNAELGRLNLPPLERYRMVDTLFLAKKRFPGLPNSLDALCRRFSINLAERSTHSAMLDCRLLAEVYIELTGGRQRGLSLASTAATVVHRYVSSGVRGALRMLASPGETAAHAVLVASLKKAIWLDGHD